MSQPSADQLANQIGANLPYLRRYARALTGSQQRGDSYAVATLEAILSDRDAIASELDPKVGLFAVFQSIWSSSGSQLEDGDEGLAAEAQRHLSKLTADTREVLLLKTLEQFSITDVANIMGSSPETVENLLQIAYEEMAKSVSGSVMIIEDEAIIATDLEGIVTEMGHRITGVARTEREALNLFADEQPDLILSDIQLADQSSGIDAVNRIIGGAGDIPVIFITAYPERLLTGEGPEPAFLISKPYLEEQVRSAVSQAMFFASSAMLKA